MKSFTVFLSLVPVLWFLSVRVSAGPGCGPCDPAQCASLPAEGCPAGSLPDSCGCCSVCAAAEGESCGGRRAATRRCGPGLECVKSDADKKNKLGVCVCKSNYEVCGTDGVTYRSGCALKSASLTAEREAKEPINVQNKGRCATGESLLRTGDLQVRQFTDESDCQTEYLSLLMFIKVIKQRINIYNKTMKHEI